MHVDVLNIGKGDVPRQDNRLLDRDISYKESARPQAEIAEPGVRDSFRGHSCVTLSEAKGLLRP
jgi:hypothetical protein